MFNNNVTSSWATPQQNQQQQQTGAFGQPSGAFGTSSGAFGSTGTSTFGQTQPAQQPQANPMFGNLGGAAANTGTGFGAFGGTNTSQSNASNPMFGAAKPSTGFGAFGGSSGAFGGGGAFGQTNPAGGSGTGAFGQPASTSTAGAFGSGSSIFGASKPTTAFGTTTGGAQASAPVVTTGSSNPPYAAFQDKEANSTVHYQSISCMPAYTGTSHEELRWQDYNQGRKTASSFGPGAFGSTQPATTGGIFGAQPTQSTSAFGAPSTNSGGFGAFGAPANTATAPATTNIFGGGGAFGQTQQQQQQQQQQPQQQTGGFGAFGSTTQQPQQQQTGGGLFGSGGAFGSTAPKPAFSAFGGTSGTGTGAFGGGGAFGQQNQQQQTQQPAGGLFGGTNTASNTGAFGSFGGANNTANKSIFGQSTPAQPTSGFGAFGSNTQQQQTQQPQQPNPLFGGNNPTTGLFGQQQQNSQQPAANPLFGGTQTGAATGGLFGGGGGGLFGNNQQQQGQTQQPAQTNTFGAFGAKPAQPSGGLFGGGGAFGQSTNTTQPTNSLFGNPLGGQQQNNQSTLGAGLFGKPAPALGTSTSNTGGLFGSTNQAGLLNASAIAPGAQGTLTASISEPIGSDLPIFNILPPGPRLLDLDTSQQKKKAGFFVDIPTRSPMPKVGYTPANSRLRGFASTSTPGPSTQSPYSSLTSSKSNPLSLSRVGDSNSSGFDAFLLGRSSSPALGSGNKQSVKKVILDKKIEPTELFTKSGGSPGLRGGKVVFSPALSAASREKDVQAALNPTHLESPTPAPRPQRTPNRFTAQNQQPVEEDAQGRELEEGDYYVKPDLATLKQTGYDELSAFKDLVVGRVGFGEIRFLEPVDLTGLSKLGALLGEVIRFDEKECSVYPESDDVDKPPPGSGLNVAGRLSLLNCWAVDKSTREPITDETHPSAVKHLKRLKKIPNTHFESFDIAEGKWTFKVDHF